MTANGIIQILLYLALLLALVKPLGGFMARVFNGEKTLADGLCKPIERLIYRICGINPAAEQHWTTYTICMLLFNLAGLLLLYVMQRVQAWLPLNPQHFGSVSPD